MALADLPDEIHSEIDDATVVWGIGHQPCLIEGRFLDAVFAERNAPIVLIKLTASMNQRCARWQNRQKIFTLTVEELVRADTDDVWFRARMFHFREPAVPDLTVDTSELTVDACAQRVKTYIRARFVQPARAVSILIPRWSRTSSPVHWSKSTCLRTGACWTRFVGRAACSPPRSTLRFV
jgi:cytidylate kinase